MGRDSCSHAGQAQISAETVSAALDRAQAKSLERGFQWTAPRRRVYELMLQAGGPVKAYDLMELFSEGRAAKPPTVYRALDFLEEQGLVHRIASINAFVACEVERPGHVAAFLICDCCGSAQEFEPGPVRVAATAAKARSFQPREVSLEVRGRCGRCAPEVSAAASG